MFGNMIELKNPQSTKLYMAAFPLVLIEKATHKTFISPKIPRSLPALIFVSIHDPRSLPMSAPSQ